MDHGITIKSENCEISCKVLTDDNNYDLTVKVIKIGHFNCKSDKVYLATFRFFAAIFSPELTTNH